MTNNTRLRLLRRRLLLLRRHRWRDVVLPQRTHLRGMRKEVRRLRRTLIRRTASVIHLHLGRSDVLRLSCQDHQLRWKLDGRDLHQHLCRFWERVRLF